VKELNSEQWALLKPKRQTKTEEQVVVNENINAGNGVSPNWSVSSSEVIFIAIIVSVIVMIAIQWIKKKCKKQLEKQMQKYVVQRVWP
jgi:hypothetical protein